MRKKKKKCGKTKRKIKILLYAVLGKINITTKRERINGWQKYKIKTKTKTKYF